MRHWYFAPKGNSVFFFFWGGGDVWVQKTEIVFAKVPLEKLSDQEAAKVQPSGLSKWWCGTDMGHGDGIIWDSITWQKLSIPSQ